jgi:hypothetical protein
MHKLTIPINLILTAVFWQYVFSFNYLFDMLHYLTEYVLLSFALACLVWCFDYATQYGQILSFISDRRMLLAQYKNGKYAFINKWIGGCGVCTCTFWGGVVAQITVIYQWQTVHVIPNMLAFSICFMTPIILQFIQKSINK